ncbi:MAG: hypothetical protein JWL90_1918 [Chthoniobacteraceae bacterium]|nr:hypothetical protein [Chthoniobacteraceae bacterium]
MKRFLFLPLLSLVAISHSASAETSLFDGKDLAGWQQPAGTWSAVSKVSLDPANSKSFLSTPGEGILLNSAAGHTVDALTKMEHRDCQLHVEFCVPKGSNSGVYLMGRYEVQVFDSFGKKDVNSTDCGGLYERVVDGKGVEGRAPNLNASKPAGEWQSFDITFRAPRFDEAGRKTENARFIKVLHNDQLIHENVEVKGPTRSAHFNDEKPAGPLLLQGDHGPVAYRNLRISETELK